MNMSQFTGRRDGGVRGTRAEKGGGHVKEKAGHRGGERDGNGQRSINRWKIANPESKNDIRSTKTAE